MKLSKPGDDDDDDDESNEAEENETETVADVRVADPITSKEMPVEEGLESVAGQMYSELEAIRRERTGIEKRIDVLEFEQEKQQNAIAELQAGFELLAEEHGMEVNFKYEFRDE